MGSLEGKKKNEDEKEMEFENLQGERRVNAKELIRNIIADKDEKKKQSILRHNQFQNELNKFRSIVSINTLS